MPFKEGFTFDDVLLIPQYSEILPSEVETDSYFSKKISLKIPVVSSAMDTVTEEKMAIAMALHGGLGVIHKNMTWQEQVARVKKVKQTSYSLDKYPLATLCPKTKTLRVAAAIGVTDIEKERARALCLEGLVDCLVVDTAHGHSAGVAEIVRFLKQEFPNQQLVVGNIATAAAAEYLISLGVDGLKVGIGPGSICTTRIVAGIGVPQLTALMEVAPICLKAKIPFIADGGVKISGDMTKALATGASCVMLGSLLAATEESPSKFITLSDGTKAKEYRGMGSLSAMERGSKERYFQGEIKESKKLVPEGIEGAVIYKGEVGEVLHQLLGGLKAGMGYLGAKNLTELQQKAQFIKISSASLRESLPHDLAVIY